MDWMVVNTSKYSKEERKGTRNTDVLLCVLLKRKSPRVCTNSIHFPHALNQEFSLRKPQSLEENFITETGIIQMCLLSLLFSQAVLSTQFPYSDPRDF